MKKLKLTVALVLIAFSLTTKAQNIIIKAGLSSTDLKMSDNSGAIDQFNNAKKSIHFGVFMDRKVNDLISFETGLVFDQKGTKQIMTFGGNTITNLLSVKTLNLPVALKIGMDASEDIRIFGKLGGYGGYNLSGEVASKVVDASGTTTSDTTSTLQIGSDVAAGDQLKKMDFGATIGAGIQYKRLSLEINYDMGLANLATDQSVGQNFKNKEFKVSLGYHFGK